MPLPNVTCTGIRIQEAAQILIAARKEMKCSQSPWTFTDKEGNKLKFSMMNDIILDRLEALKEKFNENDFLGLNSFEIREDFSNNRSFRRGLETQALNQKVPEVVINAQNHWKKLKLQREENLNFQ
jgi:hypothetical protein